MLANRSWKEYFLRRFAWLAVLGLMGILLFAVVAFSLSFYAKEDVRRLTEQYQKLQPLQRAVLQLYKKGEEGQLKTENWMQKRLPESLESQVTLNQSGVMRLRFQNISALPPHFQSAILVATPPKSTNSLLWHCRYESHPEWDVYLPTTCVNAPKPPEKNRK